MLGPPLKIGDMDSFHNEFWGVYRALAPAVNHPDCGDGGALEALAAVYAVTAHCPADHGLGRRVSLEVG